jgi:hypothetical protein
MRQSMLGPFSSIVSEVTYRISLITRPIAVLAIPLLLIAGAFGANGLQAQTTDRIMRDVDQLKMQALANHLPQWANPGNDAGLAPAKQTMDGLTMVLAWSPEQEAGLKKLLADQQNPTSPDYHHWLTPAEFGERFGLSEQDIATLTQWLQSQGLHVNWVSPSRIFIGFSGTTAEVGQAFRTEVHLYEVNGVERLSVSSDPLVPVALAPAIKAIQGLYAIDEQPLSHFTEAQSASPELTISSGTNFITPADFQTIYDGLVSYSGYKRTIGIVGQSRTNPADFSNFEQQTASNFQNPTEIVPTAFGGVDPGPALTAPPGSGVSTGGQGEATLDVLRAGSVAPNANLLLVVATPASGGIGADAQYLVQTSPVPAQVMTISFGACESSAGPSGVTFWDTLFQQAAAEGISSFVSSGDAGASGCDTSFATPPANPSPNSPNYICSSSYATCVGGTEFNDTGDPSLYWNSSNGTNLASARSYIPEGGWNEPLNASLSPQAASSGGGVSTIIPTPSWQTGTGVPAARSGRYTPDIAFSSSCHDGYFGCFAAGGGSCVTQSNGSFYFVSFCGTSAAAPSMAGVAALLAEKMGRGVGNLNPELYQMAASAPQAFNDVTVATSGVTSCNINTPSMCNNSIPSSTGLNGGQPGYLVTTGYNEVTGLGSLDVQKFIDNYTGSIIAPTVTVSLSSSSITTAQPLTATVTVSSTSDTIIPTGSVTIIGGSYTSASATLAAGSATIQIPVGSLAAGNDRITANYTPDSSTSSVYSSATGANTVTVTAVPKIIPTVTATLSSSNITTAQSLTVSIGVNGGSGNGIPTGAVTLTSGSYSSAPVALTNGSATVNVLANSLPAGTDTLTVTYTPDTASSSIYFSASTVAPLTVTTAAKITPTLTVQPSPSNVPINQGFGVLATVNGGAGNQTPTGTATLTSGTYTSSFTLPANGSGLFNLAAGALPVGTDTLTVTYTPDATSFPIYNSASGSSTVAVVKVTPSVGLSQAGYNITTAQPLTVSVDVLNETGDQLPVPSGSVVLTSGSYSASAITLVLAQAKFTIPAGVLPVGTDTLTVTYTPDAAASSTLTSSSQSSSVVVTPVPIITPTVTVAPSSSSVSTASSLPVTITVSGGSGYPTATGTVTLSSGSYTSTSTALVAGSATITVPAGSLAAGMDMLTASYMPDAASSSTYTNAAGTNIVTVMARAFTISGTTVSILPGATSGNASTITIAPSGGFTGSVALTVAITSSPTGGQDSPTLTFGTTTPASISGSNAGTATLVITTTAPTTAGLAFPQHPMQHPGMPWYATGGATLACILLFGIPARRRSWRNLLGMIALLVALTGGAGACGGGGSGSGGGGGGGTGNLGTTAGSYTLTITGTSGSVTETGTVTLTVQ